MLPTVDKCRGSGVYHSLVADLRVLLLADTHLGFDLPERPAARASRPPSDDPCEYIETSDGEETMHAEHFMGVARSLDAVLLVTTGLAVSLGHCLGMCGPLVGAIAGAQRAAGFDRGRVARAHVVYHAGRIGSYALIGLLVASLGSVLNLGAAGRDLAGALSLAVGGLMILLGLGLMGWLPTQRLLASGRLTGVVVRVSSALRQRRGRGTWFLLGAANGFLPCGPVYAVAAGTAAARPLAGAAAMFLFGLGTVPALVAFALGAAHIGPVLQRVFNRLAAVLVLLIGVQLMLRGAAALGWIGHLRFGSLVLF